MAISITHVLRGIDFENNKTSFFVIINILNKFLKRNFREKKNPQG